MKDWKTDLLGWAMTAIVVFAACSACSSCIGSERAYDSIQNQRMKQTEGRIVNIEKRIIQLESWMRSLDRQINGVKRGPGTGDVEYPDPLFPPERPKVAEGAGAGHYSIADDGMLRLPAPARKLEPIPEPPVSTRRVQVGWLHTWTWSYGFHPGLFGPRLGWGWCKTTTPLYKDCPNSHYYYPRAR